MNSAIFYINTRRIFNVKCMGYTSNIFKKNFYIPPPVQLLSNFNNVRPNQNYNVRSNQNINSHIPIMHLTNLTILRQQSTNNKLTNKEKIKKAVSQYGSTVIVFHITISLISLGTCYTIVASGLDITSILNYFKLEGLTQKATANTSTFLIAYAIHKVFAPVRIGITLTSTPFIVRYLRKIGILKPVKK